MEYSMCTDIGTSRTENQDNVIIEMLDERTLLAIVCDGMGGHLFGREASELAINSLFERIQTGYRSDFELNNLRNLMLTAIHATNTIVYEKSKEISEKVIMGTTCTFAIIRDKNASIVNVGDSRAYIINNEITQITQDHTYVSELVSQGKLDQTDAAESDKKNLLTRAIGAEENCKADYFEVELDNNDKILLCTDGLSGCCSDERIKEIINDSTVEDAVKSLIDYANSNGGTDNVTAALIKV